MNYEQAKQVIKLWENGFKPQLKTDVNMFKTYLERAEANIDEAKEFIEYLEKNELKREIKTDYGKNLKTSNDVMEEVNKMMDNKKEDIKYYNHLLCVFSHAYNGDLGRATRSAMKYKEFIHEHLAGLESRTDELCIRQIDYNFNKVGEVEKEGAYNFLAKGMKGNNDDVDRILKTLELYLTAREVKQAKKNMRKRKKKKN